MSKRRFQRRNADSIAASAQTWTSSYHCHHINKGKQLKNKSLKVYSVTNLKPFNLKF